MFLHGLNRQHLHSSNELVHRSSPIRFVRFPPYVPTHYCCHGYCIYLSIYPYWQCFKGICSLLVNVITWRQICDADTEVSLTSPTNWEFILFLSQTPSPSFFYYINYLRLGSTVSLPLCPYGLWSLSQFRCFKILFLLFFPAMIKFCLYVPGFTGWSTEPKQDAD